MPIEIVIPASDMMLAWISTIPIVRSTHMMRNDDSTASGSVTQITNTLRKCVRISKIAIEAISISCHITSVSV